MAGVGHEDQFAPPSPSGRRRFGEATFAEMGGKEEDAPMADLPRQDLRDTKKWLC